MKSYDEITALGMWALANESAAPCGGDVFYVDGNSGNAANTSVSGQGDSWDMPFSTVNYAISRCSNNAGNVIFVAADHTETIADTNDDNVSGTVTDEFCVDKSGITIIGLGSGTRRPQFTLNGATDACIDVRAANCRIYNLRFYNTQDGNVSMMDVQAGGNGLVLENCMFYASANDAEPIVQLIITANADDVTIRGCQFYNVSGGDQILTAIDFEGGSIRAKILDCVFRGDWNEHVIDGDTAAITDLAFVGNLFYQQDATVGSIIALHASATGFIKDNLLQSLTGSSPALTSGLCAVEGNSVALGSGPNHWYVDSGTGAAGNSGKSWASAVDTIDVAVGLATADNGDVIHVAAGHSETLTGATVYICDIDVADLRIIGEGQGDNRPTIICNTVTDGVVSLSADDITVENIIFQASADDMEYLILVDGENCTLKNCVFMEDDEVPLTCITVGVSSDATADGLTIDGCQFLIPTVDDGDSAISIIKDMDNVTIKNCLFRGDWDLAAIDILSGGDACLNLVIKDNIIINALTGQHCIAISGSTVTGVICGNTLVNDDRDQAMSHSICQVFDNKWSKLGTGMVGVDNVDQKCAGIHYFVDSGAASAGTGAGSGYSWAEPLTTIAGAFALCVDNAGDVIHVAPGHNESLAAAQLTWNKHGVTVLGHGTGTLRPRIDFDNAASSIDITSDDITVENMTFLPSAEAVLIGIHLGAGATNCVIRNCEFLEGSETAGTDEFVEAIQIGAGDHMTLIENCIFRENAGCNGSTHAILLKGASNGVIIRHNIMTGEWATAAIGGDTTLSKDILIQGNVIQPKDTEPGIELLTGTTGIICDNYISTNLATLAAAIVADAAYMFENYNTEVVTETGGLIGTASAND